MDDVMSISLVINSVQAGMAFHGIEISITYKLICFYSRIIISGKGKNIHPDRVGVSAK
jgi:hypothetical protein